MIFGLELDCGKLEEITGSRYQPGRGPVGGEREKSYSRGRVGGERSASSRLAREITGRRYQPGTRPVGGEREVRDRLLRGSRALLRRLF